MFQIWKKGRGKRNTIPLSSLIKVSITSLPFLIPSSATFVNWDRQKLNKTAKISLFFFHFLSWCWSVFSSPLFWTSLGPSWPDQLWSDCYHPGKCTVGKTWGNTYQSLFLLSIYNTRKHKKQTHLFRLLIRLLPVLQQVKDYISDE